MYGYNKHSDDNNKDNSSRIDKKFLDALSGFIQSVELEMDIILPGFTSLQFLSYYNIIDYIISQKLSKNIIIKMLCPLDEDSGKLTKQLVPFIGYKSIKLSLPKTSSNSLLFIRDKRDIFSFSVQQKVQQNDKENKGSDTIFYVNDWSYSKSFSTVRNTLYCFDIIWQEKEVYNKIIREKRHSELLFDVISHDIGNYYQIIRSSLELVISLFEKNNNNSTNSLFQNTERILLLLTTATNALNKSQSLVDNIRRLERLYAQKDLKLILKNLPDVINNAYTTVEQTLYYNNPQGKRIRFSVRVVEDHHPTDINVIAEDLLEEIFINLFSNSVKYTDSSEVKIDVLIKDYFIGELKYWMITVSDHGKGIQDLMKKDLFERFYSKAKGSGLGLSIVKTLVERYKGKIWVGDRVYEDYTQGTTFGMIFPAA
jgi:nitrogen-specific signal transduction histidine kinase